MSGELLSQCHATVGKFYLWCPLQIISGHPPVLSYDVNSRLEPFWEYLAGLGVQVGLYCTIMAPRS